MPSVARIRVKLLACAAACLLAFALGAAPVTVLALAFTTAAIPAAVALFGGAHLLRRLAQVRTASTKDPNRMEWT
ncbi:hypothetical protein [Dactylosporangium darangshiense]|uniref:Uncharacterized protein n=1 Tax=Dactylosporangium darangshiense TaxID=579108 RepID=A0ABP8D947_9ACTN